MQYWNWSSCQSNYNPHARGRFSMTLALITRATITTSEQAVDSKPQAIMHGRGIIWYGIKRLHVWIGRGGGKLTMSP